VEPSILHKLFGIQVGQAPRWLFAKDRCAGLDLLGVVDGVLFLAVIISWKFGFIIWTSICILACAWVYLVEFSFGKHERKGRATLKPVPPENQI